MVTTGSEWVGPKHRGGTAVRYFAGIDVSLEESSVGAVDAEGRIMAEAKVASEPEALVAFLGSLGLVFERIGLEAGPLSQWLHAGQRASVTARLVSSLSRGFPSLGSRFCPWSASMPPHDPIRRKGRAHLGRVVRPAAGHGALNGFT